MKLTKVVGVLVQWYNSIITHIFSLVVEKKSYQNEHLNYYT